MKEELIQKGLEAFLTGAKVISEEGRVLINEVINYLLFSAVLDALKSFVWGLVGYAIYKIFKGIKQNYEMHLDEKLLDYDRRTEKRLEEFYENVKKGKDNKDSESYHKTYYKSDKENLEKDRKITNSMFYGATLLISLFWSIYTIEKLRPIGKILTAPRLVLVQEGAHILKSLKDNGAVK
jgi:hypothetical protein